MFANLPFFRLCDAFLNCLVYSWVWTREIAIWILFFNFQNGFYRYTDHKKAEYPVTGKGLNS
jgi:hypothetical protein